MIKNTWNIYVFTYVCMHVCIWESQTNIIGMPRNTCHGRIMSFPDKFADPPAKKIQIYKITNEKEEIWNFNVPSISTMGVHG